MAHLFDPVPPDFIAVGHICLDVRPGLPVDGDIPTLLAGRGYDPGGSVVYSTLTAHALGLQPGIVTAVPTFALHRFAPALQPVAVVGQLDSSTATVFANSYGPHGREQYLLSVAPSITIADIPAGWRTAPSIVHLGPVAQEFGLAVTAAFPRARLIGVTPQGWLRQWDATRRVRPVAWPLAAARAVLAHADVLITSDEDIGGDLALLDAYRSLVRLVVLTHGKRGCTVFDRQAARPTDVRAYVVPEVDPTGAGDVFAAAFLVRYAETDDPVAAARFANAAASFAVQAKGIAGIPLSRASVLAQAARVE